MKTHGMLLPVATALVAIIAVAPHGGARLSGGATPAEKVIAGRRAPVRDLDLLRPLQALMLGMSQPIAPLGGPDRDPANPPARRFWVASGEDGEYSPAVARLVGTTERFRVWVQHSTDLPDDLMMDAVRSVERAVQSGLLAALDRQVTVANRSPYPVDVVFASLSAMGGYFSSADQHGSFSQPYSNRTNAVYVSLRSCSEASGCSAPLVGHELQHLLQYQLDPQEATWVNEGLSELVAASLVAAAEQQAEPLRPCTDVPLLDWSSDPALIGQHYSASRSFLRFWREAYGEAALERIATSPLDGAPAFDQYLLSEGQPLGFDSVFLQWAASEAARAVAGEKVDNTSPPADECVSPARHELSSSGTVADSVSQYGCDYIILKGHGRATASFHGQAAVPVVAVQPRSGVSLWWSNRLPQAAATLTRSLDLRGLSTAHLSFWAWYDLEEWYDWAYAAVSGDQGQTWHLLTSESTTADNPTGNNPGVGFTGESHGWVEQTADLSAFAGKTVLLRFGCLTDDAVERAGFALDDISIPEIGFSDAAEAWSGWDASGFALVSEPLRQRYALSVVSTAPEAGQAQPLPLEEDNTGNWTLPPASAGGIRILTICGLTEGATVPAPYYLTITYEG